MLNCQITILTRETRTPQHLDCDELIQNKNNSGGLSRNTCNSSLSVRICDKLDSAETEPESSCVSFKSDWSNDHLIDFTGQLPSAAKG